MPMEFSCIELDVYVNMKESLTAVCSQRAPALTCCVSTIMFFSCWSTLVKSAGHLARTGEMRSFLHKPVKLTCELGSGSLPRRKFAT